MCYQPSTSLRSGTDKRFLLILSVLKLTVIAGLAIQIWLRGDPWFALIFFAAFSALYALLQLRGIMPQRVREQVSPSIQEGLQRWWVEGTARTELKDLTPKQIDRLYDELLLRFGTIQLSRFQTLPEVGLIARAEALEDRSRFNVVLYGIDLAMQRGIKRPWRQRPSFKAIL